MDFTVALDKLGKIGKDGVIKLLHSQGYISSIERLKPFLSLEGNFETKLASVAKALEGIEIAEEGIDELKFIYNQLNRQSLKVVNLKFDITLAED